MSLADVDDVKLVGGLNEAQDYLLFRVADAAAMDALLQDNLDLAGAYLGSRVAASIYTGDPTTDTNRDKLFQRAECLLALHFSLLALKSRRVLGSHFALDQEGSERFEELIDQEYLKQVELLIEPWVTIETVETAFALPQLLVTPAIDPADVQSVEEVIADDLAASLGVLPCGRSLP